LKKNKKEERMKVIKPSFIFEDEVDGEKILKNLERYGRICYKSEDKITSDSAKRFVKNIIKRGHLSIIEHEKVTVRIICDRGISHEIVRHRVASYSQESTRYCNYVKGKYGGEITTIEPFFFPKDAPQKSVEYPSQWWNDDDIDVQPFITKKRWLYLNEFDVWFMAGLFTEWAYSILINKFGRTPEEARSVLPNSLKTEIIVTYNLREWRHFFEMRCSRGAHPQIREIVIPLLQEFQKRIPVIFDDFEINEEKMIAKISL